MNKKRSSKVDSKTILNAIMQSRAKEKRSYKWTYSDNLENASSKSQIADDSEDINELGLGSLFKGNSSSLQPYVKFRRAARAVKSLVQVCNVCRDLVFESIRREEWYRMVDTVMKREEGLKGIRKQRNRPFTAYVANEQSQCLDEIVFDASHFSREHRADYLLTESIQTALYTKAGKRTKQQITELVRYLKIVAPSFNQYPGDRQRRLVQSMWYDRYEKNRVITKQGMKADAVYVLLSGTLMEKATGKDPSDIKAGEMFGEDELICARARRSTIVTKSAADIITIHRFDYRSIVNLSEETDDPRSLDICRYDIVWNHFPLYKLVENPTVWTVLPYKFGRLIAKDSNDLEWIYVIKKGEARVIKALDTNVINLTNRKRRVEAKINADSQFYQTEKLIDFEENMDYIKSVYTPHEYKPRSAYSMGERIDSLIHGSQTEYPPLRNRRTGTFPELDLRKERRSEQICDERQYCWTSEDELEGPDRSRKSIFLDKPQTTPNVSGFDNSRRKWKDMRNVIRIPSFIQLETLRQGQCFIHDCSHKILGLRSCLEPSEHGPSASLLSAGCEILQINRKFFMEHADEAVLGLVRVKYKIYSTEEELLDRMCSNIRWERFKQRTVTNQLKLKGKNVASYRSDFPLTTSTVS